MLKTGKKEKNLRSFFTVIAGVSAPILIIFIYSFMGAAGLKDFFGRPFPAGQEISAGEEKGRQIVRDICRRADEKMYEDKAAYSERRGS